MSQIFIDKPHAEIREVKGLPENNENVIRVYCQMFPNVYTLQIRTHNPIDGRLGKGKPRDFIATVSVTIEEIEEILRQMKAHASGETKEFGTAAPSREIVES